MSNKVVEDIELQNALMLARLLGDDVPERAIALLDVAIDIVYSPDNNEQQLFAQEMQAQLRRTITSVHLVEREAECVQIEVHGQEEPLCWVSITQLKTIIQSSPPVPGPFLAPDPPTRIIGACYACAFVVARIVNCSDRISTPDPLIIERTSLPSFNPDMPVDLGENWLLGAGAVGCAILWALRYLPVTGCIHIVDPKRVTSGNLNRQILFEEVDIDGEKATVAAYRAEALLPGVELIPHVATFQKALDQQVVRRILVGLDSRETRQEAQREIPAEVFDASTTGAVEILFHYNRAGENRACLECVYPTRADKNDQSQHIADGLGLTLDDVLAPFITRAVAQQLAENFPHLNAETLVGRAISSVYRENCAAAVLRAPNGEQYLAPFAFVSILAGTLLVMNLISQCQGNEISYNVWPVSVWSPPFAPAQELRPQRVGCFCTSVAYRNVISKRFVS